VELIPLTPAPGFASPTTPSTGSNPAKPLASTLLGFLQLSIVQILDPTCITGYHSSDPVRPRLIGLTDVQQRGFSRTLTTLPVMPDYLALHAQACGSPPAGPAPRSQHYGRRPDARTHPGLG